MNFGISLISMHCARINNEDVWLYKLKGERGKVWCASRRGLIKGTMGTEGIMGLFPEIPIIPAFPEIPENSPKKA